MSQMERVFFINRMIRRKGRVLLKQVTEHFEVSERQVKRDIEFMRGRLNAPVVYSRDLPGYYYTEPFDHLEEADEKTLLYYSIISNLNNNPLFCPLVSDNVQKKIHSFLPDEYKRLTSRIHFLHEEWELLHLQHFILMLESMVEERRVKMDYRDVKGNESSRFIEPLQIISYGGKWYCVAFDSKSLSIRNFLMSRIIGLQQSEERFTNHLKKNELTAYMSSTFGIFKGKSISKVKVRFYDESLPLVEKLVFHSEQKTRMGQDPLRGEFLEFTIPVADYRELIGKILRYGASAEAVEPSDFRKEWLSKIKAMYLTYVKTEQETAEGV